MWITLYSVSRDGIGFIPWFFAVMWLAGIIGGVIAITTTPFFRGFMFLWLLLWCGMGGLGIGNVFYQYSANLRALKAGSCEVVEGPIENLHRQNVMLKGDNEHFVVGSRQFQYSDGNLSGSGLRSSKSFKVPLENGLYVKLWHRHGIICRLDACTKLSSSLTLYRAMRTSTHPAATACNRSCSERSDRAFSSDRSLVRAVT